ncbi:hypothetical protein CHS0354_027147 [Potamilus streckersoni]|uniref:Uncharacterized protein n=1 Tax=Potamilus streckersoni TaxID=2493646 RepID=A0AAE0TJ97_9BIVA|nr:hypothetical protein CHS0354_027147 [Potamilus streckersoni]
MVGQEQKSTRKEVDNLRARNKRLTQKTRVLRNLRMMLKFQQHKMDDNPKLFMLTLSPIASGKAQLWQKLDRNN